MPSFVSEHSIHTPQGKLFAQRWSPHELSSPRAAPIVLIHDSLGSVALWRDFPAQLCAATRRQVVAYDRLGFGRSEPRTDTLRAGFVREEAEIFVPCLLDHFAIDRFVPFGHSVGGSMAICCAAALPDACSAVVTESAQVFSEEQTLRGIAAARSEYGRGERFERLKKYHGEKSKWVLDAWTETWLSPTFATWNVRRELALLRCPLFALHGDEDEFGSLKHLEVMRALAGEKTTAHILQGYGHVPHKESPETIAELVADFLIRCP